MKKYCKAMLCLAIAGAMTAMTACSGTPTPTTSSSSGAHPTAMGRYVERDCALPVAPTSIFGLAVGADGAVSLFASYKGSENMELYTSADSGDTWSTREQEMVEASGLTQLHDICSKPDGGILIAGEHYSPEFLAQLEAFQAAGGGYSEELEWPLLQLMDVAPDGTVREIPLELPANAAGFINNMAIAPSGELAVQSYNEVYRYDSETGALLSTIKLDSFATSIAFCDNRLIVMADGIATIYDFESGDPLETVEELGFSRSTSQLNVSSTSNNTDSIAAVGEDGAMYFCTAAGIYRKTADGGDVLLNTLYPVFEQSLQTDGRLDEAKLRSFLEQLQRITTLQDASRRFVTDDSAFATLDMQWSPLMWCVGTEVMGMGNIASFGDFANASTAVTRVPDSRLDYISPEGYHPFIPLTSLAICSGSENAESAAEFIELALSQQMQAYDFRDGLPVNSVALKERLTHDESAKPQLGGYGLTDSDGETTGINIDYPSPEAFAALNSRIAALDTPTSTDRVVLELIKSETAEYLRGASLLDSTMTSLWQKLKLLEAE